MKNALAPTAVAVLCVVTCFCLISAGALADHCRVGEQRVVVTWMELSLSEKKAGDEYGEVAVTVEEVIDLFHSEIMASSRPSVVWISDLEEKKAVEKLEGTLFSNEDVGISLMRFHCYRVNVRDIPEGQLKEKYVREVPAFYFFDPAAALLTEISGKKAGSVSTFSSHLEKAWAKSFTMSIKDFRKEMKDILARRDRLSEKEKALERKAERLDRRPNPSLKKQIEGEKAKLEAESDEIDQAEEALVARCSLQPSYQPEKASE